MGMDMNLIRARNKEAIEQYYSTWTIDSDPDYNFHMDGSEADTFPVVEVYYSRKFWDLFRAMSFTKNYECGEYIRLNKRELKEMLDYSITHPDYFDHFNSVPELCRVYHKFDEWEARGLHVYFECDW